MRRLTLTVLAMTGVAGCGEYNFTAIPPCADNEVLTGDGKALKCVTRAGTGSTGGGGGGQDGGGQTQALVVPACAPGKVLSGNNDGTLSCVDPTVTNAMLAQLINQVASLTNRVTALEKNMGGMGGGGGGGKYVGVTKASTSGRISHANSDIGLASAAAYCNDDYGTGAHMCTNYELYSTVASGAVNARDVIPKAWVYFPAWQTPMAGPQQPLAGMADNCASYTYPTADRRWTGTAVEWKVNHQGDASAFWWHGGAEAPCNGQLPIACCK